LGVCLARLVRAVLGDDAVASRKLETGNPLVILGIGIETSLAAVTFQPAPEKVAEWVALIKEYLRLGILGAGEASKLAGKRFRVNLKRVCFELALCCGRPTWVGISAHLLQAGSGFARADLPAHEEQE